MPGWTLASIPYFVYVAALASVSRDLPRGNRALAAGAASLGLLLALAAGFTPVFWIRSIVLPPLVLLIAYHATGFLWRGPMFGIERRLAAADTALSIPVIAKRTPAWLAEFLEFSYAGVYPLIPIALALHMAFAARPDADAFWTVVLVTDYVCFGMLPLIQTRPPRALEQSPPWPARLRHLNLRILNTASIRMNTLPSGHAAEALAAALLVVSAPPVVVLVMFTVAAAISAGAVLGRYHYSVDVVTGWLTALCVWGAVMTGNQG